MKIQEIIDELKKYHIGDRDITIDPVTTRDKVLFGNPDQQCTGIVTTIWASTEVINKAIEIGANFIIVHEALFWNHGDYQDWCVNNSVYQAKRDLLESHNICVWRDHDYIHTGIPVENTYVDGIFYGIIKELHWEEYVDDITKPTSFTFPEMTVAELATKVKNGFNLKTIRLIGNPDDMVSTMKFSGHVLGDCKDFMNLMDTEGIDVAICAELIDFTLTEYITDAYQQGKNKAILQVGHFNIEEPGMKYMLNYLPDIVGDIPCTFVSATDMFKYVHRGVLEWK